MRHVPGRLDSLYSIICHEKTPKLQRTADKLLLEIEGAEMLAFLG
jgi:hypothetical protein